MASGVRTEESVIPGLRPAKLHENESRPLRVFNGLARVFDPAFPPIASGVTVYGGFGLSQENDQGKGG